MSQLSRLALLYLAVYLTELLASTSKPVLPSKVTLNELETRLTQIDESLSKLANYNLRSGSGSIGYRSDNHELAKHIEWIEIELEAKSIIDQIVIVPAILRRADSSFRADGFPEAFRLIVIDGDIETVVASYGPEDNLLPRIAPVVANFREMKASKVRLEASSITARQFDNAYNMELSEIMVFSGQQNIALHRPVEVSGTAPQIIGPRKVKYLVDGFVPYLLDAADEDSSIATISNIYIEEPPAFTIDLGQTKVIDRLHLHAVDQSDAVPQAYDGEIGMPRHLLIEGAKHSDFSDARSLLDLRINTIYDSGPIIMHNIEPVECRYIRLTAVSPYQYTEGVHSIQRYGFSEVQLFSGDENVALNKPVTANFELTNPIRSLSNLTDGKNYYGTILPIRNWISQLAERHELENERPRIAAELNKRYAKQQAHLKWMGRITALLAASIIIVTLSLRAINMRKIASLKERFAADLHDELGANLHTIGILTDLAENSKENPDALARFHQRIRKVTEHSGAAVRHCTNLLQVKQMDSSLVADIERTAHRILVNLDHSLTVEGEEHFNRIKADEQLNLLLFYKECLVNISRHSHATAFKTTLSVNKHTLHLTVSDNGKGLNNLAPHKAPYSLQRRARILKAHIHLKAASGGGTCIELTLRLRRWPWLR